MPSQISATSPGELLRLIRQSGGLTRGELLQRTGMARSTLYGRLDQLAAAGLVHDARQRSSTGGRPASVITFDDTAGSVLTVDIGHHRVSVALHRPDYSLISESTFPRHSEQGIAELAQQVDCEALRIGATGDVNLLGVGLALPAPVDIHSGRRLSSVALPDAEYPLEQRLVERFGVPVVTENDARAFALGAAAEFGALNEDGVLLGVKYSTGIGLGLMTGGHIMRGVTGAAGDLGHLQVTPGVGPLCTCGGRGCLASYASGRALVQRLGRPGVRTVSDLVQIYDSGDRQAVESVHEAAALLGTHLGGFVQVGNPQFVAFGGFLGGRPEIAARITESIQAHVSARVRDTATFRVVAAENATATGLVQLVMDEALAPERVDRLCEGLADAVG